MASFKDKARSRGVRAVVKGISGQRFRGPGRAYSEGTLRYRLRQRAGHPNLQCAGTSATIAIGGDRATRRAQIAEVGSRLFGVPVAPENVIDETLERVAQVSVPTTTALRAAADATARTSGKDGISRAAGRRVHDQHLHLITIFRSARL